MEIVKMKIGTVVTILDNSWRKMFQPLLEAGFDYFELLPENEEAFSIKSLKEYFNKKEVIIHAPFTTQNIISPTPIFRKASYQYLKRILSPLKEHFHPKVITLHMGSLPFFINTYKVDYLERLYLDFPELAIENMPQPVSIWTIHYPYLETDLITLMDKVRTKITFDVGHWVRQGYDPNLFVKKYIKQIGHIHLHDILNGIDHQELGKGMLDLEKLIYTLTTMRYKEYISIELASDNIGGSIRSLSTLRSIVRKYENR